MMPGKAIRDPIHGDIAIDGVFMRLLDTKYVQRLRGVRQNGLCYLVYPAMNSTRFEHCLGVYHLAGRLSRHLGISEEDELILRAAALLHDIGHGPFSHTFDSLFMEYGMDHEMRSFDLIRSSEISDILEQAGISPSRVADTVRGVGSLGKLLSSEVDVDKMDYLIRDAYYAGVAYGVTDIERLMGTLELARNDLIVDSGGLEAVESLLINRSMMHQTVYRHHTKRIAESMMNHAVRKLVKGRDDAVSLFGMDDITLICALRGGGGYCGDIMDRIDSRRLFKRVFSERIVRLDADSRRELSGNPGSFEGRLSRSLGIEEGYALFDYPTPSMSEYRVRIRTDEGLKNIVEVSALAKGLEENELEKLTFAIFVRGEDAGLLSDFRPEDYFSFVQTKMSKYV
jgi:uncharacterized protein